MADYCTDTFKMVEDNEDSFRMWQGLVGPYYVPIMSNDGTLRWSNNGGLPNPQEVNLMGPQGAGIRIAGILATAAELPATAPAGDIWLVGEGSPYEGYSFTGGEWIDLGPLTVGPAGPPGPQGDDYELTEADKQDIAEISEGLLLAELDNDPLDIRYGGTDARDLVGAKANLGISVIEDKLGDWPLGTDAQDVSGAINEMIGEISLQVADIQQLKDNFAGEFSPTSTYAVGAYVVYGGAFWRCTTAVATAGSWTGASNWEQVTAGGELAAGNAILQTYVRPNMLDNWYLGDGVINQRGQDYYATVGGSVDRWKITAAGRFSKSTAETGGWRIGSGIGSTTIKQILPHVINQPVTFSVFVPWMASGSALKILIQKSDNSYYPAVTINAPGVHSMTVTGGSVAAVALQTETSNFADLIAAKLEIGSTQTLAHQEGGSWVLNEIPKPEEELMKCLRYLVVFPVNTSAGFPIGSGYVPANNGTTATFFVPLPVPLAKNGAVTAQGNFYIYPPGSGAVLVTSFNSTAYALLNGVAVSGSVETPLAQGGGYILRSTANSTSLIISAEL